MTKEEYASLQRGDRVSFEGEIFSYYGKTSFKGVTLDLFDRGDDNGYPFFYPSEVMTDDFIKL